MEQAIYRTVADKIRLRIRNKKYPPGKKLPCEKKIAAQFKVSPVTIHRSLRMLADEGLLERKRRRGTIVCSSDDIQKACGHKAIGVIVHKLSDIAHPFTGEIVKGIESVTGEKGYRLRMSSVEEIGRMGKRSSYSIIPSDRLFGVIVIPQEMPLAQYAGLVSDIPMSVLYNAKKVKGACGVDIDFAAGIRQAVHYLISIGHKKIGFLFGPQGEDYPVTQQQITGAEMEMEALGIPLREDYVLSGWYDREHGYSMCAQLLGLSYPPTAVICGDDYIAVGAVQAAQSRGRIVGKDFSVIGGNDMPIATIVSPNLTTLAIDARKIGITLAEMLLDMVNSRITTNEIRYEPSLIIRNSTGPI